MEIFLEQAADCFPLLALPAGVLSAQTSISGGSPCVICAPQVLRAHLWLLGEPQVLWLFYI